MSVYCKATLHYTQGLTSTPVDVEIRDGRATRDEVDYESAGFTLLEHASQTRDWRDEQELARVHGPEVEEIARSFLGCDRALAYPPLVRSPQAAQRSEDYAPIEFVHSDFTEDYRGMVSEPGRAYRAFLDPLLAAHGLAREDVVRAERIALLQLWRNTGARRPDRPLALCDARTVPRSELSVFPVAYYGGQRLDFETFGVRPPRDPAAHHWYTFPDLERDEVIAFRTYDSRCADEGRPFWTPHTAFADPCAGPEAPARESVEMRAFCLWGV